jgi:hypothetical protein
MMGELVGSDGVLVPAGVVLTLEEPLPDEPLPDEPLPVDEPPPEQPSPGIEPEPLPLDEPEPPLPPGRLERSDLMAAWSAATVVRSVVVNPESVIALLRSVNACDTVADDTLVLANTP